MATNPNDVMNGWAADPATPGRFVYTDDNGDQYETYQADADPQPVQTPGGPVKVNIGSAPVKERGGFERLSDSYQSAVQHGFPGLMARKWYDWTDAMQPELRQRFPGKPEEWYEEQADKIVSTAQRGLIEQMDAKQAADPNWKPDESFIEAASDISKWGPWLAGQILGSPGPESLVNPGGSAVARIAGQAVMGGVSDAAYQAAEIVDEVKEGFDTMQTLGAAAAGAGLQTVFEIPGFVRDLFKGRGADTTPGVDPRAVDPRTEEQVSQELQTAFDQGASREELTAIAGNRPLDKLDEMIAYREAQGQGARFVPEEAPPAPPASKSFTQVSEEPDGTKHLTYTTKAGEEIPVKIAIDDGTAEIAINQFGTGANRLGPKEIREAMGELQQLYPEIERFGGYRKSGANPGRVQEIEAPRPAPAPEAPLVREKYLGNINTERLDLNDDMYRELDSLVEGFVKDVDTHVEVRGRTEELLKTRTPDEILSDTPTLDNAQEYGLATKIILRDALKKKTELEALVKTPDGDTAGNQAALTLMELREKAALAAGSKRAGAAGRLLNSYKMLADEYADNPEALRRIAKDVYDPKWEDYFLSLRYNMMLSGLKTHVANVVGTGTNFMFDLGEHGLAAVMGQHRRWSPNADRVMGREVGARLEGTLKALFDAATWKKAGTSFVTGVPQDKVGKVDASAGIMPGPLKALEAPSRALAAQDEWWRNVIQLSDYYGMAYRKAYQEGEPQGWTRAERRERMNELIQNPTKEMMEKAMANTKRLQFRDDPSAVAQAIEKWRVRGKDDSGGARTAKFVSKIVLPFIRTPDSLIRTAIRRSPLGVIDRYNQAGLRQGAGAERDLAKARLVAGSTLSAWLAVMAAKGVITGDGPEDYRERAKLEATGWQPNSIKIGDKYYSMQGLEPLSINMGAIASLVERQNAKEETDDSAYEKATGIIGDLGEIMAGNTWTESLGTFMTMFFGSKDQRDNAQQNFIANQAASTVTPALVRQLNQSYGDTAVRDTTGDGSLGDRVAGRVASGFPGLSEELPQRYDVLGRPMAREGFAGPDALSRVSVKTEDKDPVSLELQRLDAMPGPVPKTIKFPGGYSMRMTAEEAQTYQQLSGFWIAETIRNEMKTPEWKAMTDEEKVEEITKPKTGIIAEMRALARDALFGAAEEEEATDE